MKGTKNYKCAQATKEKLLQAVNELLKRKGYEAITIREICQASGVSNGAFYHHYTSKDDLVYEAIITNDLAITKDVLHYSESLSAKEALFYIVGNHLNYVASHVQLSMSEYYRLLLKGYADVGYQSETNDRIKPFSIAVQKQVQRCIDEGIFSRNCDIEYVTDLFIRFVRGCVFDWCLCRGNYDLHHKASRDLNILFGGLCHELT